jgi:type IV pilus assembly protein PilA
MFCALCGADNPNDGQFCGKCGSVLQGQRGMPPPGANYETFGAPYVGPTQTSGKAIGSLICGILFFFFPSAVVAIILGHLSLSDIRKERGRLTGHGLAIAGLVLGYMGVAAIPMVLIIAAIAIPNLLRARTAANEASAVGSLRTIETAAFNYRVTYSNGFPPSLKALDGGGFNSSSCDRAELIDETLATGRKNGYEFVYVPLTDPGTRPTASPTEAAKDCTAASVASFEVHADPIRRGTSGQRSFYADQTGVIRFNIDGPATVDSPPLGAQPFQLHMGDDSTSDEK